MKNGLNEADYDFEAPSRLFEAFGEEENIPVLDILPFFKEGCGRKKLYFPLDSHWNERGNRIASDAIADLWRNNKLGPGKKTAVRSRRVMESTD